uniref:Uncharacterized protein n=1 Tax=Arundo donax TaxID=35708 RepID=A0A0A9BT35_ARUDO
MGTWLERFYPYGIAVCNCNCHWHQVWGSRK